MAHPCFSCGSECYCNGSWDDVIVDHTPKNCEGCGCELCESSREEFPENDYDDYPDEAPSYEAEFYGRCQACQIYGSKSVYCTCVEIKPPKKSTNS